MLKDTFLRSVRKPFDVLERVVTDETPPRSVYSGLRTRDEGLYTQTNTQPGTSLYAADRDTEPAESATEIDQAAVRTDAFDCPDPVTCDTCSPPAPTAD